MIDEPLDEEELAVLGGDISVLAYGNLPANPHQARDLLRGEALKLHDVVGFDGAGLDPYALARFGLAGLLAGSLSHSSVSFQEGISSVLPVRRLCRRTMLS